MVESDGKNLFLHGRGCGIAHNVIRVLSLDKVQKAIEGNTICTKYLFWIRDKMHHFIVKDVLSRLQCGITDSEEVFQAARNAIDDEIMRVNNFVASELVLVSGQDHIST